MFFHLQPLQASFHPTKQHETKNRLIEWSLELIPTTNIDNTQPSQDTCEAFLGIETISSYFPSSACSFPSNVFIIELSNSNEHLLDPNEIYSIEFNGDLRDLVDVATVQVEENYSFGVAPPLDVDVPQAIISGPSWS